MLKETWIGNIKNLPQDAVAIVVTRRAGHVLSPSWQLLMDYNKRKIAWEEYVRRFYKEMNNKTCKSEMKRIAELSKTKDVYLACFERNGHCHRFLLIDMIKKSFYHDSKLQTRNPRNNSEKSLQTSH